MSEKTMPLYTVRTMKLSDSDEVLQIWLSIGWDLFKYITHMVIITDPNGSYVAQDNKTGKLLGVCCSVNLSPELSFFYNFAVLPEYQGLGIGSALCVKVFEHMGDRNISIYSENKKMIEIYKNKYNFRIIPQQKRLQFRGKPVVNELITSIDGITLVDMNDKNIADVIEYDKQVCDGLDRTVILRAFNESFKMISLAAINESNQVMGYCFVSETVAGNLAVAPLYADNQQIAELLVKNCLQRIPNYEGKNVHISLWDSNPESIEMANKLGLIQYRELLAMFTKKVPNINMNKIYAMGRTAIYPS